MKNKGVVDRDGVCYKVTLEDGKVVTILHDFVRLNNSGQICAYCKYPPKEE